MKKMITTSMGSFPADPFPKRGTQQFRLLSALLAGEKITAISAIVSLNVMIVSARASELRKMGWPIRTTETPHPNREAYTNETLTVYMLDNHFRHWIGSDHSRHPAQYEDNDGRGKFAEAKT